MAKKEKKEKRSNIYKAVTTIKIGTDPDDKPISRIDYVRAKTSAGAAKIARDSAISVSTTATLATQEDLLALAGTVKVIGDKAGA